MSVRMRVTRGHTGNRRSHHHIKEPRLSKCDNCGAYHLRHRMCPECGHYRGKQVVDIVAKKEAKLAKKAKQLEAARQEEVKESDSSKEEESSKE